MEPGADVEVRPVADHAERVPVGVDVVDLDWVQAADQYVKLHTADGEVLMRGSMADIERAKDWYSRVLQIEPVETTEDGSYWFELDGIGLLWRKGSVRLLRPSIVDAEKVLYRADWSMAGSGTAFSSRIQSRAVHPVF